MFNLGEDVRVYCICISRRVLPLLNFLSTWPERFAPKMTAKPRRVKTIKQVSTEQIELAFASALSKLLGEEYKIAIGKVDFSLFDRSGGVAHIPVELAISRIVDPTLF